MTGRLRQSIDWDNTDAIDEAIRQFRAGRGVIPVWSPDPSGIRRDDGLLPCMCPAGEACKSPGKHPAVAKRADGEGYKHSFLTSEQQIKKALSNPGTKNYGIVPRPGEVFLDLDSEGLDNWKTMIAEHGKPPATEGQKTPNGFHAMYTVSDDPGGNLFGIVTRRFPGGFVVGAGSLHPSGAHYEVVQRGMAATLPPEWTARATAQRQQEKANPTPYDQIPAGQRHDTLRDTARFLHGRGMADEAVYEALLAINAQFPQPKTPEEVRQAMGDLSHFPVDPPNIILTVPEAGSRPKKGLEYEPGILGNWTANDLPTDDPPPMLLDGWLHPEETTILYGKGGVGKGLTAAWLVSRLVQEEQRRVLILDYENHPREWGKRLTDLGLTVEEKANIHWRAPYGVGWGAKKGPIIEVVSLIAEEVARLGIDFIVIDSYSTATTTHDSLGGQESAIELANALQMLHLPTLMLAHVAGQQQKHPEKPFGSVHVHNLVARRTWSVEREREEAGSFDPALGRFSPHVISLSYRNQKSNDGPREKDREVTFSIWDAARRIEASEEAAPKTSLHDMVAAVVADGTQMSNKQIRDAIKEDFFQSVSDEGVDKALKARPDLFRVASTGRPKKWEKVP